MSFSRELTNKMTDKRRSGNHEKDFWEKKQFNLENSSQEQHLFEELSSCCNINHSKSHEVSKKIPVEFKLNSNMFQ